MTNLGLEFLGESKTFNKTVINSSGDAQNVSYIRFSLIDSNDSLKWNTTNISNLASGLYALDVHLSNNTLSYGLHYAVWDGYYGFNNITFHFYYQDHIYIDDNKLL